MTRRKFHSMRTAWAALCGVMSLAGCETLSEPVQSLAGGSAMQIEVEVYKGPLADDTLTQWNDLVASVVQARHGIDFIGRQYSGPINKFREKATPERADSTVDLRQVSAGISQRPSGGVFCPPLISGLRDLSQTKADADDAANIAAPLVKYLDAVRACLETVSAQATQSLLRPVDSNDAQKGQRLQVAEAVAAVAAAAGQMLPESQALLRELAVEIPSDRSTRKAFATLANAYCQYGNQIGTRADALVRELRGLDPERFSTGAMIRNTKPCGTLDAFVWFNAFDPPLWTEVLADPVAGIASDERRDRVRALERLFADLHWSRVNTVYASGQGKTTMALIRDQYGNWDLKAFENDPTALLEAYTSLAKAALSAATGIASGGALPAAGTITDRLAAAGQMVHLAQTAETGDASPAARSPVSREVVMGGRALLRQQLIEIRDRTDLTPAARGQAAAEALRSYTRYIETLQETVAAVQSPRDRTTPGAARPGTVTPGADPVRGVEQSPLPPLQ